MAEPAARLYLVTPVLDDASFAARLEEACAGGNVAAVLLRLAAADERSLINQVKMLGPSVQEHGAALIVAVEGEADIATIAARSGADGVHVQGNPARVRELRERLKDERAIGVGGIRTKDDAMTLGEAGVDYLLLGEPRPDGSLPALESVADRAAWWAEIFETPCIAYAPSLDAIPALVATRAEFIALSDAVWSHEGGPAKGVAAAVERIGTAEDGR